MSERIPLCGSIFQRGDTVIAESKLSGFGHSSIAANGSASLYVVHGRGRRPRLLESCLSYNTYKTFIAINVMSSGCLCSLK